MQEPVVLKPVSVRYALRYTTKSRTMKSRQIALDHGDASDGDRELETGRKCKERRNRSIT